MSGWRTCKKKSVQELANCLLPHGLFFRQLTTNNYLLGEIPKITEKVMLRAESTVMLSALVGAMVLSRSALDPALSDRILEHTREWLKLQTKA